MLKPAQPLQLALLAAVLLAATPASAASPDACSITVSSPGLEMTIPIVSVGGVAYRATLSQHNVSGSSYLWWTLSAAAPLTGSAAFAGCTQPDVYSVGQGMYGISSGNVFYNGQRYQGEFMLSSDAKGVFWLQLMSSAPKP